MYLALTALTLIEADNINPYVDDLIEFVKMGFKQFGHNFCDDQVRICISDLLYWFTKEFFFEGDYLSQVKATFRRQLLGERA